MPYRVLSHDHYPYFVTCTIVEWLPIFKEACYQKIVLDALTFIIEHKHTQLNAFVIMSSHLHAVLWPEDQINLSDVLRDFKRFTSKAISAQASLAKDLDLLKKFASNREKHRAQDVSQFQVWQDGFHPEAIFTEDFARQKIDYIHMNPVKAGLVSRPEDWPFSSARAYLLGDVTSPPVDLLGT
jgi:REP element-mobilizing transposase RayT